MKTSVQQFLYRVCTVIVIYNGGQLAIDTITVAARVGVMIYG